MLLVPTTSDKPKNVVLEYAANLLSLIVTDVRRPLDEYEPIALLGNKPASLPYIKQYMLDPKPEENVTIKPGRI